MLETFGKISVTLFVAVMLTQPAFAGFDLGGMIDAGKDLTTAATLSDGDVKQLASEAAAVSDTSNTYKAPVRQ